MISGNSHIIWVPLQQVGDELPITFLERRHMWSTNPSLWNWSFHDFVAPAKSLSTSVDPGALGLDVGMPGKCLVIGENMEGDVELGRSSLGWDFQKQTKIWRVKLRVKDNLVVLFHLAIELVDPGHWYFYRRTWISIMQGWSYIPTEAANQHNKT